MIEKVACLLYMMILLPAYQHYRTLCRSRQHPIQLYGMRRANADSFQAGSGKYGACPVAFIQLAHASIYISSQVLHVAIPIAMEPLRPAANGAACNAECSIPVRKIGSGRSFFQYQYIIIIHSL